MKHRSRHAVEIAASPAMRRKKVADGPGRLLLRACALLAGLLLAAGCASKQGASPASRPGEGIAEYRQIAADAQKAMRAALDSLAEVSAQSNRCPPEVLSRFSSEVRRLQVDSIKVRARSQAMLARGDDYFEHWHQNLANVKDPDRRALAQKNRPALQEAFRSVKLRSQDAHEAFQPFLSNLRKVRNALEKAPESVGAGGTREWMASAAASGAQVERCLADIQRELDSMTAMVTPPGNLSKSSNAR